MRTNCLQLFEHNFIKIEIIITSELLYVSTISLCVPIIFISPDEIGTTCLILARNKTKQNEKKNHIIFFYLSRTF